MTTLTKPFTFTGGTFAVASQVNSDFDTVFNWINTNAIWSDASRAFTAVPTGPGTDPSSANQLARATYVTGNGMVDGLLHKIMVGKTSGVTDSSGNLVITFPHAFGTACDAFVATVQVTGAVGFCSLGAFPSTTGTIVKCWNTSGTLNTTSLTIHWQALGH